MLYEQKKKNKINFLKCKNRHYFLWFPYTTKNAVDLETAWHT